MKEKSKKMSFVLWFSVILLPSLLLLIIRVIVGLKTSGNPLAIIQYIDAIALSSFIHALNFGSVIYLVTQKEVKITLIVWCVTFLILAGVILALELPDNTNVYLRVLSAVIALLSVINSFLIFTKK